MPVEILTLGLALLSRGQAPTLYSQEERAAVETYWAAPGRYTVTQAQDPKGAWVVRLTKEGSHWLWAYNKARGMAKVNPLVDAGPQNSDQAEWENWISAKVAFDRYEAALKASEQNAKDLGVTPDAPEIDSAPDPGPMPQGLSDLAGDAPAMAVAVKPNTYTIHFDDAPDVTFTDQVPVRPRYAYFRWPEGVNSDGTHLKTIPQDELDRLYGLAGIDGSARKVMSAVSPLEGGFDSINTYDTGFVSVGFLQFACLEAGAGSLGAVLLKEKQTQPDAFKSDFRRFGVEVDSQGRLVCIDMANDREICGGDAARQIISDKRLTAVFQRAGRGSDAFRVAQIQVAKEMYYPADDPVSLKTASGTVQLKVGDFVRSEAGMAILMDRKVNLGNIRSLSTVAGSVWDDAGAKSADDLAAHEMEIVESMVFRQNFLGDASLTQPFGVSRQKTASSRHGDRKPVRPPAKPKGDGGGSKDPGSDASVGGG